MTSTTHRRNFVFKALVFAGSLLFLIASCDPKNQASEGTNQKPDEKRDTLCPPVNITQFWKLELMKSAYDSLKAQATNGGAIVFQFAYTRNNHNTLTLAAYAAKAGRDFQPPLLKYLAPIEASTLTLPDSFSVGDQKIAFVGPRGLNQLIAGSPVGDAFYSLTFTPNYIETTYEGTKRVRNITYKVCVKYASGTGYLEYCGANEVELQPSPPANHGN